MKHKSKRSLSKTVNLGDIQKQDMNQSIDYLVYQLNSEITGECDVKVPFVIYIGDSI